MKVIFRVDSSYQIGTGHVYRCLRLANELQTRGHRVDFLCKQLSGEIASASLSANFAVNWVLNEEECCSFLSANHFDILIIDHYSISASEEALFRPFVKRIVVIDDLENRSHVCDAVIDINYKPSGYIPYENLIPQSAIKLIGPSFALLAGSYAKLHLQSQPRQKIRSICLFFGGTDVLGETIRWYKAALNNTLCLEGLTLHFIVARSNQHLDYFIQQQDSSLFKIHIQPANLAELMLESDLYIGSGGTITWERSCVGLTGYVISVVDNQTKIAKDLHNDGFQKYLGTHLEVDPNNILSQINSNNALEDWLAIASRKCLTLTDGLGTTRVCSALENLI